MMQYQSHSPQPFVQGNDRERVPDPNWASGTLHTPPVIVSTALLIIQTTREDKQRGEWCFCVCVCVCVCVDVMQYQSHSPQPFVQGNDRERVPDPNWASGTLHTPPVIVSTALLIIQTTREDKQRGEWCFCVCVCVCACDAVPIPLTSTICARK